MPESPRWLILKGRLREARSILCWTSSSIQESECQYTNICYAANIPESQFEEDIISVRRSESNTRWDLLRFSNPALLHMSVCAIMIQLAQKASGCDTIVLYLPQILEKAGVVNINEKVLWILLIDISKTVCVIVAAFLLDRYGRRKLLLISIGGMVVSLVTLGSCLINIDDIDKNRIDPNKKKELWVSQICIVSLFFLYGILFYRNGACGFCFYFRVISIGAEGQGMLNCVRGEPRGKRSGIIDFLSAQQACISWRGSFFICGGRYGSMAIFLRHNAGDQRVFPGGDAPTFWYMIKRPQLNKCKLGASGKYKFGCWGISLFSICFLCNFG